jgi:hypothetical protein
MDQSQVNRNIRKTGIAVLSISLLLWAACSPRQSTVQGRSPGSLEAQSTVVTSKLVHFPGQQSLRTVRLFKSTNYPPQTAEEKAQWEWWRAMRKADESWEWKMPIEFYGKVVDQFSNGVDGATVDLCWTTVVGPSPDPKKTIYSGSDGRFSITGIQGRGLSVDVDKAGYVSTGSNSFKGFEYAEFYAAPVHIPDSNQPVIFKLQKLLGAEPMYKFLPGGDITIGGDSLVINVETGKKNQLGDLACSVTLGPGRGEYNAADFTVTLSGQNGAGFRQSDEEFLFNAPDSGYQSTLIREVKADDPDYHASQTLRFYMKTSHGKYAAVEARVTLWTKFKTASFSAIVYYNPSGSQNLEFDQRRWINR